MGESAHFRGDLNYDTRKNTWVKDPSKPQEGVDFVWGTRATYDVEVSLSVEVELNVPDGKNVSIEDVNDEFDFIDLNKLFLDDLDVKDVSKVDDDERIKLIPNSTIRFNEEEWKEERGLLRPWEKLRPDNESTLEAFGGI